MLPAAILVEGSPARPDRSVVCGLPGRYGVVTTEARSAVDTSRRPRADRVGGP